MVQIELNKETVDLISKIKTVDYDKLNSDEKRCVILFLLYFLNGVRTDKFKIN